MGSFCWNRVPTRGAVRWVRFVRFGFRSECGTTGFVSLVSNPPPTLARGCGFVPQVSPPYFEGCHRSPTSSPGRLALLTIRCETVGVRREVSNLRIVRFNRIRLPCWVRSRVSRLSDPAVGFVLPRFAFVRLRGWVRFARFIGSSHTPVSQPDTSAPRFRRRSVAKRANSEPGVSPKCQVASGRILPVRDDPRFMVDLTSQRTTDNGPRACAPRTPSVRPDILDYRNVRRTQCARLPRIP